MSINDFLVNLHVILFTRDAFVSLFIAFIFGSLVGSFLNVCVCRIPLLRSVVYPGSSCFSCGEPVKSRYNLPVLGYLILRGKCYECGASFSYRYALVELTVGIFSCVLFYLFGGFTVTYFYFFAFFCVLTIVFLIDLDYWLILDAVIVPSGIVGLIAGLVVPEKLTFASWVYYSFPGVSNSYLVAFIDSLSGGMAGFLLFSFIAFFGALIFKQEAMGGGDIKFAFLIGVFLGLEKGLQAFLLSFFAGALSLLPVMIFNGKSLKEPVPFGTFMAIGAGIAFFFGDFIKNWLFSLY